MAKDSELVREAEDFLKGKGIEILEMKYNRDSVHYMKPTFSVLTNNYKSLDKLARDMGLKFLSSYDERSCWKTTKIENSNYDLHITHRGKPFNKR